MSKFNWDAFLGGVADTGLDAYRTTRSLGLLGQRENRLDSIAAFEMGGKTPIIRAPAGGLGGVASSQMDEQAGLPTDYSQFDSVGSIGAAPPVEDSMGDVESRREVGGRTAMSEEDAAKFVQGLQGNRRKEFMMGVEQAEAKQTQAEVGSWLRDLSKPLEELRKLKAGADAAQKIIDRNRVQIQHMVSTQDAYYQQYRDAPDQRSAIDQKILTLDKQIEALGAEIQGAQKALSGSEQSAELVANEAKRISRTLEMLGVEPELIENYRRVYSNGGDIGNAGRLILIRIGRGVGTKAPSKGGVAPPRPQQSPPRRLR